MKKYLFIGIFLLALLPSLILAQRDPYEGIFNPPLDSNNPFINNPAPYQPGVTQNSPGSGSSCGSVNSLGDVLCLFSELLNKVVPVLVALGVVYFVFGVVQYVIGSDEEAKKKGRNRIIFGIIGLAVIVGLWGLVTLVVNTFDLDNNINIQNPATAIQQSGAGCFFQSGQAKVNDLLNYVTCIISTSVIPLIFMIALAMFIWGVVQFTILGAGEEAKREQGRQFMLWGIIALAVMVSVWGLVSILANTFGVDTSFVPRVKQ